MAMGLIIRAPIPSDIDALAALHSAAWREIYGPHLKDDEQPAGLEAEHRMLWQRTVGRLPPGAVLRVAMDEHRRLAGFVATLQDPRDRAIDHLVALHTAPTLRGRGVGSALMARLARDLAAGGRERMWCYVTRSNEGASAFFRRLGGFEGTSERIPVAGNVTCEEIRVFFPPLSVLRFRDTGASRR